MPGGGPVTSILSLGYDPQKGRFVGTWLGSCMTNLWVYDGALDAETKLLTLDSEGPHFTDERKMGRYQDIIEMVDGDHRILSSQMLGDDGQWYRFMTTHYYRKK